ncbi:hypothetical protein VTP01DRAFT_2894 [Rhizomucor pusillus]|uniref:uncharacterized protein n=1 Tax=Rhizomucor pusillus TaxID=4840 RepID=UPI0037446ED3
MEKDIRSIKNTDIFGNIQEPSFQKPGGQLFVVSLDHFVMNHVHPANCHFWTEVSRFTGLESGSFQERRRNVADTTSEVNISAKPTQRKIVGSNVKQEGAYLELCTITIMPVQWVYQAGTMWVPFDPQANACIENLWRTGSAANVYVASLRGMVYVNGPALYAQQYSTRIVIARTGS